MFAPKTLDLAFQGFRAFFDQMIELRGAEGLFRMNDDETLHVITSDGCWPRIQLDDALALLLSTEFCRDEMMDRSFDGKLAQRLVSPAYGAMNWQHQFRQIIKLISLRRLQKASIEERRILVAMLAYARASLSFTNNRPNGLAAAIHTLHQISRIPAFLGEFEDDLRNWALLHKRQRKLASLIKLQSRIERQISQLAA